MDFGTVLYYYFSWFFTFLLQITVAEGMFVYGLKRRPLFWLRLIASLLVCAALLLPVSIIYSLNTHFLLGGFLYIVVFAMTVVGMKLCFAESLKTLIFCGIAAYSAQNMAYRLYYILEVCGVIFKLTPYMEYMTGYLILSNLITVAVYLALYFLFARRIKKYNLSQMHSRSVLLISAFSLIVTVVLCSWTSAYYWQHRELLVIICLFSVLACVFILCLQSGILENLWLKQDIAIVEQLWRDDVKRYEIARENIEFINIKCHDLKHRIREMQNTAADVTRDDLREIEEAVDIYDSNFDTGCKPLDVLLTEKNLYCLKRGIRLNCLADGGLLSFMCASELYSLFGNMLSNAVEAVDKLSDTSKKSIDMTVRRIGDMLHINIRNYYGEEIEFKDGIPQTSKADKANHGFGMKSMKMLAKKYNGDLTVSAIDNIYSLTVLIPLPLE